MEQGGVRSEATEYEEPAAFATHNVSAIQVCFGLSWVGALCTIDDRLAASLAQVDAVRLAASKMGDPARFTPVPCNTVVLALPSKLIRSDENVCDINTEWGGSETLATSAAPGAVPMSTREEPHPIFSVLVEEAHREAPQPIEEDINVSASKRWLAQR